MKKDKVNINYWDEVADKYSADLQEGRIPLAMIYQPVVDELLGDVCGKRILDAGCGDSHYARKLTLKQALVTGIDGSERMIAIARAKNPEIKVDYKVMDLTKDLDFESNYFDVVLANMVLMDTPKIDIAIMEFARILKKNGSLVFSITHPCFFCSDWVLDEKGTKLYKPVSDYLNERVEELNFWGKTLYYHRPLSCYFNILADNDFCVVSLREPIPSDKLLEKHPEWGFHKRIPSFIVVRAILCNNEFE